MQWAIVELGWTGSKWSAFARLVHPHPFGTLVLGYNGDTGVWHFLLLRLLTDKQIATDFGTATYDDFRDEIIPWPWQ